MELLDPEGYASYLVGAAVTFKVLIVGSFGVGKTTLINQISSVPVVGTEVATTGPEALLKQQTTVGIEYGLLAVGDDDQRVVLLLFGTPGQDRFSDVRDVAANGVDGIIVLVDGRDPSAWETGGRLLRDVRPDPELPVMVVVNWWVAGGRDLADLHDRMGLDPDIPVSCGNVTDPADARRFVIELLSVVLDRFGSPADERVGQT